MRLPFVVLVAGCLALGACTTAEGPEPSALRDELSAVAAQEASTSTDSSATLRWAVTEPAGITPDTAVDGAGLTIVDLLFDSLTAYGPGGTAVPSLAASWRSQDNGERWVFTLRNDRFHDGTVVTAADVARGWESAVRAGRPQLNDVLGFEDVSRGSVPHLRGLQVLDARTLAVRLSAPDMAFPLTVAHPSLGPLPPPPDDRGTDRPGASLAAFRDRPIGNGPFAMAEPWARGRFVRLTRADRAVPSPNAVQEVVFQMTDAATAYVRFQQGRVDIAPIPGGAFAEAIDLYGEAADGTAQTGVHTDPRPGLVYLGVNTQRAPLDDIEVRRAVSLAIDRSALSAEIGEGNVEPASSMVPPAVPGHHPGACTTCRRDVSEARRLFAERGVTTLELIHEASDGDEMLVDRLRRQLGDAGVELVTRGLPFPDLLSAVEEGAFDLHTFGWITESPTRSAAIPPLVSGQPRAGVNVNFGGYQDDEVDRLLSASRSSPDAGRRARLLTKAEEIALGRDQAIIPLYTTNARVAVAERIRGLMLPAYGELTLDGVTIR